MAGDSRTDPVATVPSAAFLSGLADVSIVTTARFVDSIGSTNAELLAGPVAAGTVLITDEQTAGRGRRGRSWHAPPGTSLMFSIALDPHLQTSTRSLLTLIAGNALVAGIGSLPALAGGGLGLKWPNDLLIDGVKAAGILAEGLGEAVVVGMGINVDWSGVLRPADLQATSLVEAAGAPVDRWPLLRRILEELDDGITAAQRDPAGVVPRYVPNCLTIGRDVTATVAGRPVSGTAVGLTVEGHLRIRREDGRDAVVTAGEVHHLR